jgi:NAD-dependent dihydropyrimidine dehydrogenase PreA subunit
MTHVITSLCLRDSGCVEVCPVDCIVPGVPQSENPLYYIDPDTCIDCGACVPACPYNAIFPESDIPTAYTAKGGEYISRVGLTGHYEGVNEHGVTVVLETVQQLAAGETVDLTPDTQANAAYFQTGPGYKANDTDEAKAARG